MEKTCWYCEQKIKITLGGDFINYDGSFFHSSCFAQCFNNKLELLPTKQCEQKNEEYKEKDIYLYDEEL